jgi:hypothetical protein
MAKSRQVQWDKDNLARHYGKHPGGEDRDCWAELTGLSAPIPCAMYEQASLDTWKSAKISVRYVYLCSFWDSRGQRCVSRFDDRGIRVIVVEESHKIKTCYHLHEPNGKHLHPRDIFPFQLQQMIKSRLQADFEEGLEAEHEPRIEDITWPR